MSEWLRYFDLHFYRTHKHWRETADLKGLDDEALITHFIQRGWRERRGFSAFLHAFIDPVFYREQYPKLGLKDDLDAVAHWMYEGFFEGRIPNSVTRDVLESEIHLFQPGKVASKAIEKALYAAGHRKHVLHLHFASGLITSYPDCNLSYREVVNTPRNKVVNFITGVRDPFERIISGHFQANLSGAAPTRPGASTNEVCRAIQDTAFSQHQVDNLLNWFEHKFYRDVDIFRYEFDSSAGYRVIEQNNLRIFLYRFENIASLEEPLSRFIGLDLRIEPTNTSREKPYSALYKAVVESVKFPSEHVEYVLNSRMVRHFYTASEINRMRKRWTNRSIK
jgi:hypothetical protein